MTILKLKDYQEEVFDKVKKELSSDDYFLRNPRYKATDEQIRNIIGYFAKHKLQYNTETGVTTLDGEWDSAYSNIADRPSEEDAVDEFIHSAALAYVINAIQNPYFDNDKLVYKHESYKGKKTMKKRMNEDAKIIANLYNDFKPWSGAVETWEKIKDVDMLEDLDRLLEEMYPDGIGMTELNDLLWFEDEWVLEQLGLAETEDEEVEESLQVNEDEEVDADMYEANTFLWDAVAEFGYRQQEELAKSYPTVEEILQYSDLQISDSAKEYAQEILDYLNGKNESLKPSRKSSRKMNENDEIDAIWDYLIDSYTATQEELELVTSINGYSVETLNKVIYARTGMRNIEQLKQEYGEYDESLKPSCRRRAVSEISDEVVDNTLSKRNQAYNYANKKWVDKMFDGSSKREQNKAWKEREKASTKRWNAEELAAKRKARKEAQQESLSSSLIKSAHSVLSMNEGIGDEMNTWSFKAKGFSKMLENKQPTFGNQDLRCIIHENKDGNIEGVVVTNYAMPKEQVEESLKETLRQNGFKSTSISELTVLY